MPPTAQGQPPGLRSGKECHPVPARAGGGRQGQLAAERPPGAAGQAEHGGQLAAGLTAEGRGQLQARRLLGGHAQQPGGLGIDQLEAAGEVRGPDGRGRMLEHAPQLLVAGPQARLRVQVARHQGQQRAAARHHRGRGLELAHGPVGAGHGHAPLAQALAFEHVRPGLQHAPAQLGVGEGAGEPGLGAGDVLGLVAGEPGVGPVVGRGLAVRSDDRQAQAGVAEEAVEQPPGALVGQALGDVDHGRDEQPVAEVDRPELELADPAVLAGDRPDARGEAGRGGVLDPALPEFLAHGRVGERLFEPDGRSRDVVALVAGDLGEGLVGQPVLAVLDEHRAEGRQLEEKTEEPVHVAGRAAAPGGLELPGQAGVLGPQAGQFRGQGRGGGWGLVDHSCRQALGRWGSRRQDGRFCTG